MKRKMRYILAFFCLLLIDFFAFSASLFVAYAIRVYVAEPLGLADRFQQTVFDVFGLVAMFLILAVVFLYEGLYTKREPLWDEMGRIIKGISISFAIIFSFSIFVPFNLKIEYLRLYHKIKFGARIKAFKLVSSTKFKV